MKTAHNITLSVFAHEEEDVDKIEQAFLSLLPFDITKEKLQIKKRTAQGFKERKIRILEMTLTKERHTNKFLTFLKEKLSKEQISLLSKQIESRLDEELNFFLRLDKPTLIKENRFHITDEGNCYHIKMSIAAYPAKRDIALKIIRSYLDG